MSCSSQSVILRPTLLIFVFIVSCTFIASVVWLLRTKGLTGQYESYYLSRINISGVRPRDSETATAATVSEHYKDLIKIEIAMRRVEENSRRLKQYTKSLLWDNKDKSLWCVLFKDNEKEIEKSMKSNEKQKKVIDEEYIKALREERSRDNVIHLRHHGNHHRHRPENFQITPYFK